MTETELIARWPALLGRASFAPIGPGWVPLLARACERIQAETDRGDAPQAEITVVKEKWASLRIYLRNGTDAQHQATKDAEIESEVTCEVCGATGSHRADGWHRTRCDAHTWTRNDGSSALELRAHRERKGLA